MNDNMVQSISDVSGCKSYERKNAFSIFVIQDSFANPKVRRVSVFGRAFPSSTYDMLL